MRRHDLLNDLRALRGAARRSVLCLRDAAVALQLSQRDTTLRMRVLVRLGAVHRIARGLFFIVPIETKDPRSARPHDSWVVASARFQPCYIGGWTAADAWNLYLSFKGETFVVTSSRVRALSMRVGGIRFRLAHIPERLMRSPSWLGGARPLARALREHRRSDRWDPDRFVETLLHVGSAAAIKRLDALDHLMDLGVADVLNSVAERRTRGIVALEPGAGTGGRINTRCGVRLNVDLDEEETGADLEFPDESEDLDP